MQSLCGSWASCFMLLPVPSAVRIPTLASYLARSAWRCQMAYILLLWFFFLLSFFRCLISVVAEPITAKLGDIFTYDDYLQNSVWTYPHIYLQGLGAKTTVLDTSNFDRTYLCNETRYQQSERNLFIYRDLNALQIWWILVQKQLRTVGKFLPTP